MGRKKYSVSLVLCALKMVVFVVEKKIMSRHEAKKIYFDSDKNHSPPPLFKLNGCSLIVHGIGQTEIFKNITYMNEPKLKIDLY